MIYFFTLCNFKKTSGGTLRILGLINSIEKSGRRTTLLCNKSSVEDDYMYKTTNISCYFSPVEKRIFQFLISFDSTFFLVDILLFGKLRQLRKFFSDSRYKNIIFCEYLDNSVGYYLKKKGLIDRYTIDLHGIAHVEFQNTTFSSVFNKYFLKLKYISSLKLDKKVIGNAYLTIYASNSMRAYFIAKHSSLKKNRYIILPYLLDPLENSRYKEIDENLKSKIIKDYAIAQEDQVVFFAGSFKHLSGILDLIQAFYKVSKEKEKIKLFLIGTGKGYLEKEARLLVEKYNISNKVIFVGRIPYSDLLTYQSIANVIVCPDMQNTYSNLIIHLKYLDSLKSGKIVINGAFDSVLEINKNDCLSISFEPSNVSDLAEKIKYSLENEQNLLEKFSGNIQYVDNNLLYDKWINLLISCFPS